MGQKVNRLSNRPAPAQAKGYVGLPLYGVIVETAETPPRFPSLRGCKAPWRSVLHGRTAIPFHRPIKRQRE